MVQGIITKSKRKGKPRGGARKGQSDAVGQYASDAWSLAKRTAAGLNEIRKLINIETKIRDFNQVSYAQGTTATLTCVSSLDEGLDFNNRVGDSIKLQDFTIRGRVNVNSAATTSLVRVIILRDLDAYGTALVSSDVLAVSGSVGAPLSPVAWLNRERFSILYDELFAVASGTSTGDATCQFTFHTTHSGHVLYLGTSSASASNGRGSIYVLTVSDEATNTPSVAFYSRMTFTDD
jgi:hypothetical protein